MPVRCPKCGRSLEPANGTAEVRCPHCGTTFKAEAAAETKALTPLQAAAAAVGPSDATQELTSDQAQAVASGRSESLPSEALAKAGRMPKAEGRPTKFAQYEIVDELGRGGMGVVYKAFDPELKRTVALKVLLSAEHASKDEIERFFREASSAAKLQHPNIVPIHELKVHEGKHYYTMDLIEGEPLDKLIADKRLTVRQSLELLEKVAKALDHAHTKGIVHRDLKPANIIVGSDGEPKVTDFGLAKVLSSEEKAETVKSLTGTGVAMGSIHYESPEQASGRSREVDARSDVYSLGCILYELLTGAPPFVAGGALDILRMQVEADPVPPTKRGAKVSDDVETICLKCLEKEPARRYQTAGELAEDLRRFLDGEPIAARRASVLYVTKKKLIRHKVVASVVSVAAMALVAATAWYIVSLRSSLKREADLRGKAEVARRAEAAERARAEQELYCSNVRLAHEDAAKGSVARADGLLATCPPRLRNWEWGFVRRELHQETLVIRAHGRKASAVAFSPDGKLLASAGGDQTVKIWDAFTGAELRTLKGHQGAVRCVAFRPDGARLASGGQDGTIRIWDAATGAQVRVIKGHRSPVVSMAFGQSGQTLVSCGETDATKLWNVETGDELRELLADRTAVGDEGVAFSPDGGRIATAASRKVTFWDARTGERLGALAGQEAGFNTIAFNPDGKSLASGDWPGVVRTWDVETGRNTLVLRGHQNSVACVAYSPKGRLLASCGALDNTVRLWDVDSGEPVRVLRGHSAGVWAVAFSPDGLRLASASWDGTIRLWEPQANRQVLTMGGQKTEIAPLAFSPDGKMIARAGRDHAVEILDAKTLQLVHSLRGHRDSVTALAFTAGGTILASGSTDKTVRLWDLATGRQTGLIESHQGWGPTIAFRPDGKALLSGHLDGTVRLWGVQDGKELLTLRGPVPRVRAVALSPDAKWIAASSDDGTVRVWNAATGGEPFALKDGDDVWNKTLHCLAFSPDSRRLAWSKGKRVAVWQVSEGRCVLELPGHEVIVPGVGFSPDGQRLATGGYDRTVRIWDAGTGRELLSITHPEMVHSVAFSPDGMVLASADATGTVRLWLAHEWKQPEGLTSSERSAPPSPTPPAAKQEDPAPEPF